MANKRIKGGFGEGAIVGERPERAAQQSQIHSEKNEPAFLSPVKKWHRPDRVSV
jgi:hypothetical protein